MVSRPLRHFAYSLQLRGVARRQEAGPTVFAPFPEDTAYFGANEKTWMINFRVGDLDAMVAQLQTAGISDELTRNATLTAGLLA